MSNDVLVAAFRDTLRTSTGTDDFTSTGLGSADRHRAVFLFGNHATTDATPADHTLSTFGCAVSSTNRRALSSRLQHGVTETTDGHRADANECFTILATGSQSSAIRADFDSFIPDGFRVDVEQTSGIAPYVNGLIFSGGDVRADIKTVTVVKTINATADVAIDFEPNLIVLMSDGDQFTSSGEHGGMACTSICFCRNDKAGTVTYAGLTVGQRGDDESRGSEGDYGQVSTTRFLVADPTYNGAAADWQFELSFPDPSTARITTKTVGGDPAAPEIALLLIDTGTVDVQVGVMSTPTATGAQTVDLGLPWEPQAMLWGVSQITAVDTWRAQSPEAGTVGFAAASASVQCCATTSSANLADPTDTQSLSDDKVFLVPDHDGGTSGDLQATFTRFTPGGLVADFTAVNASALRWPYLAIEKAPRTGGARGTFGMI